MLELRLLGGIGLEGSQAREGDSILRQPKRLALLAYLAVAPAAGFERRDRLVALFWPEFDEERARRGLRQSLHVLRAAFGADAFLRRGDAEVALNEARWRCDAREVTRHLDAGEWKEGVALYRGDLLPGFHLSEAPEFERWLEGTRASLRRRVSKASEALAADALARGDALAAVPWLQRALDLSPENEVLLRQLVTTLDRAGDRTGALHALASFERRLKDDFAAAPAPETAALAVSLRAESPARIVPARPGPAAAFTQEAVPSQASPGEAGAGASRRGQPWGGAYLGKLAAAGFVLVGAIALLFEGTQRVGHSEAPTAAAPVAAASNAAQITPARLLYEQGVALWSQGDAASAERLMAAALEQDSALALARLQLGHLLGMRGEHAAGQRLQRDALAQAARQSDHDRLLILTLYADRFQLPRQWAVAETLAIRYPQDVEGQLLVAKARRQTGNFLEAVAPLRRVAYGRDAVSSGAAGRCFRCEAFGLLTVTYEMLDSTAAVERTTRDWTVAFPGDASAWAARAYQLASLDRYQDALGALRRSEDIRAGATGTFALEEVLLRAGDFATVGSILQVRRRTGASRVADGALFLEWKSLREQGRFRAALALADTHEALTRPRRSAHDLAVTMRATSLAETGFAPTAVAIWDSLGRLAVAPSEPAASVAGATVIRLANLASALARAGDTVRLAAIADSAQAAGALSGWARNQRLHWYVRGELSLARRHVVEACRQFSSALLSATTTFAPANLAAGRGCLRAGQPEVALRAARGLLRGPVGAGGAWGTMTEAHEIAGRAFSALGQADSAAVHLARVQEAWRNADAAIRSRLASVAPPIRLP